MHLRWGEDVRLLSLLQDEGLTLPVAASRDCWLLELSARCLGEDALSGADSAMDAVAAALKQ